MNFFPQSSNRKYVQLFYLISSRVTYPYFDSFVFIHYDTPIRILALKLQKILNQSGIKCSFLSVLFYTVKYYTDGYLTLTIKFRNH